MTNLRKILPVSAKVTETPETCVLPSGIFNEQNFNKYEYHIFLVWTPRSCSIIYYSVKSVDSDGIYK